MTRRDRLHAAVYQQLGANRLHQRWITPVRTGQYEQSIEGLAWSDGIITISPYPLVPTIIHEALHRAYPQWSERAVQQATTYLERRMSDDEMRALYDAFAAKVRVIRAAADNE